MQEQMSGLTGQEVDEALEGQKPPFIDAEWVDGELVEPEPHPTGGRTWDLLPGTFVVLEGIDQAGKSTQAERLQRVLPDSLFTHQPSGGNVVGEVIYALTEAHEMHPVTRQLLHLASHAEHYERTIIPRLSDGSVVMDRCWWSTIAYGYFSGNLQYAVPDYEFFERLAKLPTQGMEPDVVFVFMRAWRKDRHNTTALIAGYNSLIERYPDVVETVPADTVEATTQFIIKRLQDRELLQSVR